jgi:RNA polymerase sigma factor (sigma-70 family)
VSDAEERFERVFREHYGDVYRYAARRVDSGAVQDVVAETFLAAWRRHEKLRDDPLPWLLGVARRIIANHRRGDGRRAALSARLNAEHRPSPRGLEHEDSKFTRAFSALSERDRDALMLVAWDGLEHHAAASVMGCSPTAFTVRLHRARRKLERALESHDGSPILTTKEARSMK